ncbi:hypothetical protein [Fusicatenibacter saccharivorans]|uniref:hypothetical protein n=1 Tax=Fusicatenibacter saccharivorans TaxID=1150298 RepID=UPI003D0282EC
MIYKIIHDAKLPSYARYIANEQSLVYTLYAGWKEASFKTNAYILRDDSQRT